MRYVYGISDDNHILIWDTVNPNEGDIPFFSQPIHPDGRPWINLAEAEKWVESFIAELVASDEASGI